jgi:hypothetical protein
MLSREPQGPQLLDMGTQASCTNFLVGMVDSLGDFADLVEFLIAGFPLPIRKRHCCTRVAAKPLLVAPWLRRQTSRRRLPSIAVDCRHSPIPNHLKVSSSHATLTKALSWWPCRILVVLITVMARLC